MVVAKRAWGNEHRGNICVFKAQRGSWRGIASTKRNVWLIECEVAPKQDPKWLQKCSDNGWNEREDDLGNELCARQRRQT